MKKRLWMLLAALCLLWPAGSLAEGLPGFEEAIEAVVGADDAQDVAATAPSAGTRRRPVT